MSACVTISDFFTASLFFGESLTFWEPKYDELFVTKNLIVILKYLFKVFIFTIKYFHLLQNLKGM